jgi:hypothetical protein
MPRHRKFSELEAKLDANPDYPAIAERVAARLDAEDAAYEHSLRELRKALGMTQAQLAKHSSHVASDDDDAVGRTADSNE